MKHFELFGMVRATLIIQSLRDIYRLRRFRNVGISEQRRD